MPRLQNEPHRALQKIAYAPTATRLKHYVYYIIHIMSLEAL
jgi:hypothetical protein